MVLIYPLHFWENVGDKQGSLGSDLERGIQSSPFVQDDAELIITSLIRDDSECLQASR